MNQSDTSIPGAYLFALSECMNDFGIDPLQWLDGTGFLSIDSKFIESSIDYQVFRELVLRAIKLSKNQAIGISVGHRLSLKSHGSLGDALMNCENILSAVKLLEQYIALRIPLIKLTIAHQNDEFVVQFDEKKPLHELRIFITDALLVTVKSCLDQIMPSLKKDLTLCFPYSRHKNIPYGSLSGCTVLFNEPAAAIRFPQQLMEETVPFANLAAYKKAEMLCAQELTSLIHESTFKSRIKQKLLENTELFPAQTVMASWFNMTSRTLHRRLVSEDTSYREILEEVKQALAITYLSNSTMSIKDVSYVLGYDDDRNFSRAFRRWKGMSPSEYRRLSAVPKLDG